MVQCPHAYACFPRKQGSRAIFSSLERIPRLSANGWRLWAGRKRHPIPEGLQDDVAPDRARGEILVFSRHLNAPHPFPPIRLRGHRFTM